MSGQIIPGGLLWALLFAQGTVCIAIGLAVSYLLRRHPARAHQTLLFALAASLLMPASYLLVRHFELGMLALPSSASIEVDLPAVAEMSLVDSPLEEFDSDSAAIEFADTPLAIPVAQTRDSRLPWTAILLALWATASAILLGRTLLQFVLGLRLLRESAPLEMTRVQEALEIAKARIGIRRPVVIRSSPKIQSPVIWCWSRVPVLLVQEVEHDAWNDCDWAGVFCHELAHLKRRDHLSGLFADLLAAAIPWRPLPWWARERLSQLSEEACDDWVLAGGRSGVDYAESLLSLSPQRRVSFLPTVVGKERTMKARIYRIVRNQCSNPRISRRWALSLWALGVLVIATVALAQPQPKPVQAREPVAEPKMVQSTPPQEPAVAGRRNVLQRMLDQLIAQAEETEAALRRRGGEPSEETEVLRSELHTLRDQIGRIERQLRDLQQGPRFVPPQRPTLEITQPRQPEARARARREAISRAPQQERPDRAADDRVRDLSNRLRELQEQVRENARQLERLDDPDSEEARDRRAAIETTHREMAEIEAQIQQLQRDHEARNEERQLRVTQELASEVARSIAAAEQDLREQEERGQGDSEAANALRQKVRSLRAHARSMDEQVRELRRRRSERNPDERRTEPRDSSPDAMDLYGAPYGGGPARARIASPQASPDVQRQVEELRGQVNGLNDQMQEMREMLRQLLERRSETDDKPQEMKQY